VYHSWEIRRLRRFKTLVIEEERESLAHSEDEFGRYESRHSRSDRCPTDELNTDRGSALAFRYSIGLYEHIDQLLESAARRLSAVLAEIHYYRENLAHLLEEFSNKIIDAEYAEAAE
jgi:hypothetical protein